MGKIWLLFSGGLLAAILAASFIIHQFNRPSVGTVTQTASKEVKTSSTPQFKELEGDYFTIEHPENFNSHPTDTPRAPYLETYNMTSSTKGIWELAIQIESLPSGELKDDSSYFFRRNQPERFERLETTVNGRPVEVMSEIQIANKFSKSAFMKNGDKLGILTLTGNSSKEIEETYQRLLQSWRWK